MRFSAGQLRIVIEQKPFAIVLHDGVVIGPAKYRCEHNAFVGEWAVGRITDGVSDVVGIAGGVGQIIFAVKFMYPCTFKEAAIGVGAEQRYASAIKNLYIFWWFSKLQQVIAQLGNFRAECWFIACWIFIFSGVSTAGPAL